MSTSFFSSSPITEIPDTLLNHKNLKYKEELKLGVKLALEAGENIHKHCESVGLVNDGENNENNNTLKICTTKQNYADFATEVDILNEEIVIKGIEEKFPAHNIIGEESTGTGDVAKLVDNKLTWIIDPVDGTTNFASGLPLNCVSIGLCDGLEPVMGVVYAPMTNELYLGVKGCGSYRNGKQIKCPPEADKKTLRDSIVLFEFGYAKSEESVDKMLKAVRNILLHGCRTTRTLGSGVLDLCYVATGRIDVAYTGIAEEGWKPWDYCAAAVIVQEAGGFIQSLRNQREGAPFDIYSKDMICAVNEELLKECRDIVLE